MTQRIYAIFTAVLASVMLWHSGGCLAVAPGGQVREGLGANHVMNWLADGSLTIEGAGTQTQAFTMATGRLALTVGPDGKAMLDVANSHVESWLQFDPSATSAENVMGPAFEASTRQVEILANKLGDIVGILAAMVPTGVPPPTAVHSGIPPPDENGAGG